MDLCSTSLLWMIASSFNRLGAARTLFPRSTGAISLTLPSGSKVGDQLEALVRIDTQGKSYGAVICFSIQKGEKGFGPSDVTVESFGMK